MSSVLDTRNSFHHGLITVTKIAAGLQPSLPNESKHDVDETPERELEFNLHRVITSSLFPMRTEGHINATGLYTDRAQLIQMTFYYMTDCSFRQYLRA